MLLIKTYIGLSKIQGIGLFADEDVKKGELTWRYEADFDRTYTIEEVEKMPSLQKQFMKTYAALSPQFNVYIFYGDDARFTNHSMSANIEALKGKNVGDLTARANRDIKKGEELTINYKTIDKIDAQSNEEYLNT